MTGFVEGRVIARRDWAPGLMTLGVSAAVEPFKPGQFLNLGLPIGTERLFRSYSMASAPGARLEFFLTEVSDGRLSTALFGLALGDPVLVDPKPQGFFTLDWVPPAEELWMVATGTGLGPFIAMLRSGLPFARFARVVVVHGVRARSHLAYATEIASLAATHAGRLRWVPVVSREPEGSQVLSGRVTEALDSGALEKHAGLTLSPERSHVLLCGNPAMIADMLERLAKRGLMRHRVRKPGHVTTERYWE